jgi:hypothetical protein
MGDIESRERAALAAEELVLERRDEHGALWRKVYFGGGEHLMSWLAQCREVAGEENVVLEPVDVPGLACFSPGGERACRIWVRAREGGGDDDPPRAPD